MRDSSLGVTNLGVHGGGAWIIIRVEYGVVGFYHILLSHEPDHHIACFGDRDPGRNIMGIGEYDGKWELVESVGEGSKLGQVNGMELAAVVGAPFERLLALVDARPAAADLGGLTALIGYKPV